MRRWRHGCVWALSRTAASATIISAATAGRRSLSRRCAIYCVLGVYQLLFLDRIPARAAVSEAVALCKSQGCARAAGLVNAVLRRIADNIELAAADTRRGHARAISAIKYSHPAVACVAVSYHDRKGYDFAEEFLRCCNSPAPLTHSGEHAEGQRRRTTCGALPARAVASSMSEL